MKPIVIESVTVSVTLCDKDYGKGSDSFFSLKGNFPDGLPISQLDQTMDKGLDMYFAAWKTLLASRYVSGVIDGKQFKDTLAAAETRIDRIRKYIVKVDDEQQQQ
jgi:hypothetical protein